ncbi:MAG TPA: hypothetical protein VMV86_05200, partial [Methanosarcinales archaeon]|nr:hypothetical protein [Methanosarcinales archaeon]
MAYEIGTASDYQDLLERLKDFLSDNTRIIGDHPNMDELEAIDDAVGSGESSQAWTVNRWVDNRDSGETEQTELIMNGPGLAGTDEIYVGIQCEESVSDDYYNWKLMGCTGYSSGSTFLNQPSCTQGRLPRMLLWDQSMPYWFVGNGRRCIVVAKVSSVYECMYLGFGLPYGLPSEYPYPMVVGGAACPDATVIDLRYSSTDNSHRSFASPYGNIEGTITN